MSESQTVRATGPGRVYSVTLYDGGVIKTVKFPGGTSMEEAVAEADRLYAERHPRPNIQISWTFWGRMWDWLNGRRPLRIRLKYK